MYKPRKSLGQNFLKDENILRKIINSFRPETGDVVVEIGPGQGALTKHLILHPITLFGIDVDKRAIELLRQTIGEKAVFIHANILDVELQKIFDRCDRKLRIIGNIPYYLTSDILFWLFEARKVIDDAVIMMQLEVARRLTALPRSKDYGILSVFTRFYSDCDLLFKVSRNCFFPRPDVDSAVVRLKFKRILPQVDEALFRAVVRSTFGKRRKTLRNGLKFLNFEDEALDSLPFDLTKRPEELQVSEFIDLTKSIGKIIKS